MRRSKTTIHGNSRASMFYETPVARRAAGIDALRQDMKRVNGYARYIRQLLVDPDQSKTYGVLEAASWHSTMLYARCFDNTSRGRGATLAIQDVKRLKRPEFVQLHSMLISWRHEIFAHQGEGSPSKAIVHLLEPMPYGRWGILTAPLEVTFHHEHDAVFDDADSADLLTELTDFLVGIVESKFQEAQKKLVDEVNQNGSKITRELLSRIGKHASAHQQEFFDRMGGSKPIMPNMPPMDRKRP